ncbi:MAG: hypothetical protein EOP06_00665 [Proteobacteria bacterium]|nr:MAG: hypothetical protein EOP06_00665 [Pseudomonadota bacterium]
MGKMKEEDILRHILRKEKFRKTRGAKRNKRDRRGESITVNDVRVEKKNVIQIFADRRTEIENSPQESEILLLQAKPIGVSVAAQGPFVMNTPEEIRESFAEYRKTHFGGWPWPSDGPVYSLESGGFVKYADGRSQKKQLSIGGANVFKVFSSIRYGCFSELVRLLIGFVPKMTFLFTFKILSNACQ